MLAVTGLAGAQRVQPELRLDVLGPTPASSQPGLGAAIALGNYVRAGAAVGYALEPRADLGADRWRADLLARVTLDPFRQQRWGFSLGGGLSFRRRTYLAAILDLEGPETQGILPAVQFGVSGGVRAGIVLRRALKGRR
jgi:hypothetical protein